MCRRPLKYTEHFVLMQHCKFCVFFLWMYYRFTVTAANKSRLTRIYAKKSNWKRKLQWLAKRPEPSYWFLFILLLFLPLSFKNRNTKCRMNNFSYFIFQLILKFKATTFCIWLFEQTSTTHRVSEPSRIHYSHSKQARSEREKKIISQSLSLVC